MFKQYLVSYQKAPTDKTFPANQENATFQQNKQTQLSQETESQNFSQETDKAFQLTRTRYTGVVFIFSLQGGLLQSIRALSHHREGVHKREPDYNSPRSFYKCLLPFSTLQFTLIVHGLRQPLNLGKSQGACLLE